MQRSPAFWIPSLLVLTFGMMLALSGCKEQNAAPPPLAANEIPGAMQKAFSKSNTDTKQLVEKLLTALQAKDYPGAYQVVETISRVPGLTKDQLVTAGRAMLGINELLKSASAGGDQSASAFISYQKHNR